MTAQRVAGVEPLVAAIAAVGEREVGEDAVRTFLEDPASVGIVGAVDGVAVGYVIAYLVRRIDGASMLVVYDLAVAADHRRLGVGRAMVDEVLATARRARCSKAWVVTEANNEAAVGLYVATGAQHSGEQDVVMAWEL